MIRIKIYNPAGDTIGRPTYATTSWGTATSDTVHEQAGVIESGAWKGEILAQRIEGAFDLYNPPYAGSVNAYVLAITEAGVDTVHHYREEYSDPIRVAPYWEIPAVLARADVYANTGIEFTGNRFANTFWGANGNDNLQGEADNHRLSAAPAPTPFSSAASPPPGSAGGATRSPISRPAPTRSTSSSSTPTATCRATRPSGSSAPRLSATSPANCALPAISCPATSMATASPISRSAFPTERR